MTPGTVVSVSLAEVGGLLVGIFAILSAIIGVVAYSAGKKKQTTEDGIREGSNMSQLSELTKDMAYVEKEQAQLRKDLTAHDITLAEIMVRLDMILKGQERLEKKMEEIQKERGGI